MGQGYEYKVQYVRLISVPLITSRNEPIVNKIEEIINKIIELKRINSKVDTKEFEEEIDHRIYSLFELTKDEISVIEKP